MSAMFKWADSQGYLGDNAVNPFKGLAPNKKVVRKETKARRPFTDDELLTGAYLEGFPRTADQPP